MIRLRRALAAVSPFVWLGLAIAASLPLYLRYFGWALGHCGAVTFMPVS